MTHWDVLKWIAANFGIAIVILFWIAAFAICAMIDTRKLLGMAPKEPSENPDKIIIDIKHEHADDRWDN